MSFCDAHMKEVSDVPTRFANLEEEGEVLDDASLDDSVVPERYDITSFGADYDVDGLVKRLKRGDIFIPPFQRNYVWDQKEASRFIESLLLGLPVPGVFLAREPDSNKLLVIDGQQRLKTLQFFYEGHFNPKQDVNAQQVFTLQRVQTQLEGLTYATLPEQARIKLDDSLIHATIIKQDSPQDDDTSVYHIFDRLNSSGRRLTPQEIRTAIYHGAVIDAVKELDDYPEWREIFGSKNNRLKDQELILRFLALHFEAGTYRKPMEEFLNRFAMKHRRADPAFIVECGRLFRDTISAVSRCVGSRVFRLERTLNAAVFDSVMVGLSRRLGTAPAPDDTKIAEAYHSLLRDEDYLAAVSRSTSDETSVKTRIDRATQAFAGA